MLLRPAWYGAVEAMYALLFNPLQRAGRYRTGLACAYYTVEPRHCTVRRLFINAGVADLATWAGATCFRAV